MKPIVEIKVTEPDNLDFLSYLIVVFGVIIVLTLLADMVGVV